MAPNDRLAQWADTFPSRAECARRCGLSPQSLGHYIAATKKPGTDVLARMAAAGLDVNWYLMGSGPETPTETGIVREPLPSIGAGDDPRPTGATRMQPPPGLVEFFTRALDAPIGGTVEQMAAAGLTIPQLVEIGHQVLDALGKAATGSQ